MVPKFSIKKKGLQASMKAHADKLREIQRTNAEKKKTG